MSIFDEGLLASSQQQTHKKGVVGEHCCVCTSSSANNFIFLQQVFSAKITDDLSLLARPRQTDISGQEDQEGGSGDTLVCYCSVLFKGTHYPNRSNNQRRCSSAWLCSFLSIQQQNVLHYNFCVSPLSYYYYCRRRHNKKC